MPASSIETLIIIDENTTKNHPEIAYDGAIPEYADEMDYVVLTQKGAIIA